MVWFKAWSPENFLREESGEIKVGLRGRFWWSDPKSVSWRILLGHDESGPMLGLKLLVGPRWREFHCLAARPWFIGRERGL